MFMQSFSPETVWQHRVVVIVGLQYPVFKRAVAHACKYPIVQSVAANVREQLQASKPHDMCHMSPGALPHDPTTCVTCPPGLSPREVPTISEATRSNKKQQEAPRSNKKQQEATGNNKNQQEASRSSKKQEKPTRSIKKQQEATRSMLMFSRRIWKVFCIAGPVIYGNRGR